MTRARWTIIWPTGTALRRADRLRSGEITLHSAEQPDTDDLGLLVDTALRIAPDPGRELLVLDPRVTARPVELDAAACAGLADEDLDLAIAFELESLVGLNAPDSALASMELIGSPGTRRRLALALPRARLDAAVQAAARFGIRRVAVTSPHALPRPIAMTAAAGASSRDRYELWEEGLARWSFADTGEADFVWRDTEPAIGLLEEPAEARAGALMVSALSVDPVGLEEGGAVLRLEQPEDARRWIEAWFEALTAGDLPALRPAAKPLGARARAAISALLLILVMVGAGALHTTLQARLGAAKAALDPAKRPAAELARLRKEWAALKARRDKLMEAVAGLEHDEAQAALVFDRTRKRWPRLLGSLARHMTRDMVLTEIRSEGAVVEVVGIEERVGSAGALSSQLARDLGPLGWRVSPASESIREDGRRDFTLRLGEGKREQPTNLRRSARSLERARGAARGASR